MRSRPKLGAITLTLVVSIFTIVPETHPCDPGWLPGDGMPGLIGNVEAMTTWDPDGAGPATTLLVAGGANILFSETGPASNIVAYDGQQWFSLGAGVSGGTVTALAVFSNELIVAGSFTSAGGQTANRIARWNGTTWNTLGVGLNSSVNALAVYNNQLYAAGFFTTAGGSAASKIARWDGTSWSALGTGLTGTPLALAVFNGYLYVGGGLTNAGGVSVSNLARWNGTSWSSGGTVNNWVNSLSAVPPYQLLNNPILILGGDFTQAGGVNVSRVAGLNTSGTFVALGAGLSNTCRTVFGRRTGAISFEVHATTETFPINPQQVWRYTTSSGAWNALGGFDHGFSKPLAYHGGIFYVGVYDSDGSTTPCVQSWNGQEWVPVGKGIAGRVNAVCASGDDVVVGGEFEFASDMRVNHVARRDAVTGDWLPLGDGEAMK